MRALMLHGFGEMRVDQRPDPVPRPDDVVLEVACVQPSVTECMLMAGHQITLHEQLGLRLAAGPVALGGHEFAAVVRERGTNVEDLQPGERVTAVETIPCGDCTACRRARPDACGSAQILGFTRPGAFAESVCVPASSVVRVPPQVSAAATAAIQPLAGALHAHDAAHVRVGESVLIIGAGVMGLLCLQVARHGNAGLIAVSGRTPAKLALAERWGADVLLEADADVVGAAGELTGGVGFDVVIETASGAPEAGLSGVATLETAARCARRGGRIVMVSAPPSRAEVPLGLLRERALALLSPASGAGVASPSTDAFSHALRLVARGDVNVEAAITHSSHGIETLPRAIEMTLDKKAHGAINPVQVHLPASWPKV